MSNTLSKAEIKALTEIVTDLVRKETEINNAAKNGIISLLSKCEDNEITLPVGTDDDLSVFDCDCNEYRSIDKVKLVPYKKVIECDGDNCNTFDVPVLVSNDIWYQMYETTETYVQILNRMVNELD